MLAKIKTSDNYKQLDFFTVQEEASLYHSTERYGFFAVLQNTKTRKKQKSYKLEEMPLVLSLLDKTRDSWISQAEFFKPNRRVVNLWRVGLLFADIDTYTIPNLRDRPIDYLVGSLLHYCDELNIPKPSIVIYSGRGLQAKWLLEEPLPRAALPRWNACQRVLVDKLRDMGADPQAKDASRVLRLVQTINSKSNEACQVVHVTEENNTVIKYDFEYLCEFLLPFTREQIASLRLTRKKEVEARQAAYKSHQMKIISGATTTGLRGFSGRQLAWHRLEDLRALVALRGGYKQGERMHHLFWQLNFLLLSGATNTSQMWHEAAALARGDNVTLSAFSTALSA